MLTCCPQCRSWFRVRAEHLSMAGGQVTCGECDTVFNALASLVEEAPAGVRAPAEARTEREAPPEAEPLAEPAAPSAPPAFHASPERALPSAPEGPLEPEAELVFAIDASLAAAAPDVDGDRARDLPGVYPLHSLSEAEHAILFTAPGGEESDDSIDDTVPEARAMVDALYAEVPPPPAPPTRLWSVLAVLSAVALLAQLAWLERTRVEAWLPASRPLFAALRARLDCAPAAPTASVRLVARDVREHPQYRDALLVNATLVNEGATPEPYPTIELRLHDAGGRVLGARRFTPAEYLDQSIFIADGMPPAQPVYIVMELGGDAAAAASFEFTFL